MSIRELKKRAITCAPDIALIPSSRWVCSAWNLQLQLARGDFIQPQLAQRFNKCCYVLDALNCHEREDPSFIDVLPIQDRWFQLSGSLKCSDLKLPKGYTMDIQPPGKILSIAQHFWRLINKCHLFSYIWTHQQKSLHERPWPKTIANLSTADRYQPRSAFRNRNWHNPSSSFLHVFTVHH